MLSIDFVLRNPISPFFNPFFLNTNTWKEKRRTDCARLLLIVLKWSVIGNSAASYWRERKFFYSQFKQTIGGYFVLSVKTRSLLFSSSSLCRILLIVIAIYYYYFSWEDRGWGERIPSLPSHVTLVIGLARYIYVSKKHTHTHIYSGGLCALLRKKNGTCLSCCCCCCCC